MHNPDAIFVNVFAEWKQLVEYINLTCKFPVLSIDPNHNSCESNAQDVFFELLVWFNRETNNENAKAIKALCSYPQIRSNTDCSSICEIALCLNLLNPNLPAQNVKFYQKRMRRGEVWLLEKGGNPPDWNECTKFLESSIKYFFSSILLCWDEIMKSNEDRDREISSLLNRCK